MVAFASNYTKKKSSESIKLLKLLIIEHSPGRRSAAGAVHRFR